MVEIQCEGGVVTVRTAGHNRRFERLAVCMGARRLGEAWIFPLALEKDVRLCCAQVFGARVEEHRKIFAQLLLAADAARKLDSDRVSASEVRDLIEHLIRRLLTLRGQLPDARKKAE